MKIAYVYDNIYPYSIGGAEKRIWELATRMIRRGQEVTIFGMKFWEGDDVIYKEGVRLWGVCPPQELFVNGRRSIKAAVYFAWKLLPFLLKEKFDIIDCQNFPYFTCFSAKLASFIRKSCLVITWHEVWDDYWYEYLGKKGFFGKAVEKFISHLTGNNIAVSEKTKDDMIKSLEIKKDEVAVIPNGIDLEVIGIVKPASEEFDLVFAGRLIKERNIDVLIDAMSLLKEDNSSLKLGIIGDGPEREKLQNYAKSKVVNAKFFGFLESFEDVLSIMKASRIFVHPSTREGGASIVSLEANACGLPVIAVKHELGIDKKLIIDGYNGYFVDLLSPELIAEKVRLLLEEEGSYMEIKANAVTFAREYDWNKIATLLEEVYFSYGGR